MSRKTDLRVLLVVAGLAIGVFFIGRAVAGLLPMPLKADLDLAGTVAVGKITAIVKDKEEAGGKIVLGRATVAVSEMLKGPKADEITMTVVMSMDRAFAEGAASPPRVYKVGDEGIWLIGADGRPMHGSGLLDKGRLEEVKTALAELDKRKWSDPADGLKVWAGVGTQGGKPGDQQSVIFAVKNVGESEIWLPRSMYEGVVVAVARDSTGTEHTLPGVGLRSTTNDRVTCRLLKPGETRYMHPDYENYGAFVVPKDLPPGKYTVTVTLANAREGTAIFGPHTAEKIEAWKGKVAAPTFTLETPKRPETQPTSRRGN
jgi:hypothetical protein